ncbi:sarcoplasmic calcium-binding protein-like [Mercenaria mercenaria]|uniref:sarcoplasmic calcium-binding protein-like n=1 Tax=Mercenaria mercenaria TaxID=6596 RepID=UPI00234F510E|nr:sarcoplasmic calcium-binding protein-like [Mercenaria mercenaria]
MAYCFRLICIIIMANDYLKRKWGMWFKVIDGQQKHRISHEDMTDIENKFAILSHMDAEQRKRMQEILDNLVNENVFYGKPGPVSKDEFIEMQNEDFKTDKDNYIAKRRHYFTVLFETMNVSGNGITEEEFVNTFRSVGHENISLIKQFFHSYNPEEGVLPLSILINSWVQFTTCEDSSKPDIVKAGLESGV